MTKIKQLEDFIAHSLWLMDQTLRDKDFYLSRIKAAESQLKNLR